jgi:hypothetical protein
MRNKLDAILCTLSSLGMTLADLATAEDQPLRSDCIADLGRLVSEKANQGLDVLADLDEHTSEPDRG